ncbi:exodeoxyribonuclease VII small subunit [Eubacteriales bacterium KG127]
MNQETFEKNLLTLNQMSDRIRMGNLPLEEALNCYKEGMKSYKACIEFLNEAKLEIETVTKKTNFDSVNLNEEYLLEDDDEWI